MINAKEKNGHLLAAIMENISDGIFIADKKYNTIAYSEAYRLILGASKEEMIRKNILDFYKEGRLSNLPLKDIIETGKHSTQLIDYYSTGKTILCTGVPVYSNNELEYVILSFRDLTALNKLQNQLAQKDQTIQNYKKELYEIKKSFSDVNLKNENGILYKSKKMHDTMKMLNNIAKYDSNVLITGSTGVGKSLFAKAIHEKSHRKQIGNFINVDCASIPDNLIEAELFGYERGAFTGASTSGKEGLVELANNGTLFLDEIGEMPIALQSKLLTLIEDKRIRRIGSNKYININIRIIAATNKNLISAINKNEFRSDLYFRLNVLPLEIPTLAERSDDIIPLFTYFAKNFSEKYEVQREINENISLALLKYSWPGNIRELIHAAESFIIFGESFIFEELKKEKAKSNSIVRHYNNKLINQNCTYTLRQFVENEEKTYLMKTLNENKTLQECANILDINISTLVRKMKKYKLSKGYKE